MVCGFLLWGRDETLRDHTLDAWMTHSSVMRQEKILSRWFAVGKGKKRAARTAAQSTVSSSRSLMLLGLVKTCPLPSRRNSPLQEMVFWER